MSFRTGLAPLGAILIVSAALVFPACDDGTTRPALPGSGAGPSTPAPVATATATPTPSPAATPQAAAAASGSCAALARNICGACCLDDECKFMTPEQCCKLGGTYVQNDLVCKQISCRDGKYTILGAKKTPTPTPTAAPTPTPFVVPTPTPTPDPGATPTPTPIDTPTPTPTATPTATPTPAPTPLPVPSGCETAGSAQEVFVWGDDPGETGDALDDYITNTNKTFYITLVTGDYFVTDGIIEFPSGKPGTLAIEGGATATLYASVSLEFNNQCLLYLDIVPPAGQTAIQVAANQTQGQIVGCDITGDIYIPIPGNGNPGNNTIVDGCTVSGSIYLDGNNNTITNNTVGGCIPINGGSGNVRTGNSCGGSGCSAPVPCND